MFDKEDFKISIEKELSVRVVNDEINHCDDIETLRKSLIAVTRLYVQYQHLIEVMIEKSLMPVMSSYALKEEVTNNETKATHDSDKIN
tara:strand:- start:1735 stop:1998 length:264 start_codon:yes stop_codon:yes gene_type:complete